MKNGRDLERLVRQFERVLTDDESVTITSPKRMPDKITGQLREHDVVLEIKTAHHTNIIAFECRDRNRPVGVNAVEAFANKCESTGVDKAVVVSSSGFTAKAREKAAFYSIECFDLEKINDLVTKRFTIACPTISFTTVQTHHIHWNFQTADGVDRADGMWELVNPQGETVNPEIFNQLVIDQLRNCPEAGIPGPHKVSIGFPTENLLIRDSVTSRLINIAQAVATVEFEVLHDEPPIENFQYSRNNREDNIARFSLARQKLIGKELSLVFTTKGDEPTTLSLQIENLE